MSQFLIKKSANLVHPDDSKRYNEISSNVFNASSITVIYFAFWAFAYNKMRLPVPISNKIVFYSLFVGVF